MQATYEAVVLLVLCSLAGSLVCAMKSGPPLEACHSMQPGVKPGVFKHYGHVSAAQNQLYYGSPCPVYIHVYSNTSYYEPGSPVTLGVIANQTLGSRRYKGLLLQARPVTCASDDKVEVGPEVLGTFSVTGSTKEFLLTPLNCFNTRASALSHFSPQWKSNETATWHSPGSGGHIVFWATIVQDVKVYWTHQHSRVLLDRYRSPPPPCVATAASSSLVCMVLATIGFTLFIAH